MIDFNDGVFTCKVCGKTSNKKFVLQNHMETHIKGLSLPCQQCGKTFRSTASLKNHSYKFHIKNIQVKKSTSKAYVCKSTKTQCKIYFVKIHCSIINSPFHFRSNAPRVHVTLTRSHSSGVLCPDHRSAVELLYSTIFLSTVSIWGNNLFCKNRSGIYINLMNKW